MAPFEEPRPTAVSVVGWAWVVLGPLAAASGALYALTPLLSGSTDFQPLWFSILVGGLQFAIGVTGLVGGIAYLRLTPWSRPLLEAVSWVTLALMLSSPLSMLWLPGGFSLGGGFGLIFGIVLLGFSVLYCVPFVLMIRSLRSQKVRAALSGPAQQAHRADAVS